MGFVNPKLADVGIDTCYALPYKMENIFAAPARGGAFPERVLALPESGRSGGSKVNQTPRSARKPLKGKEPRTKASLAHIEVTDAAFAAFFERAPFVMFVYDPKSLKIVEANGAAVIRFGYSREELSALSMSSLVQREEEADFVRRLRDRSIAPQEYRGEWRLRTREGRRVDVELRTIRARCNGRRVDIAVAADVSTRKRAVERLHEARRRYADLFRASPAPMWAYDSQTLQFVAVNDAATQHYGYSRDEFLSMALRDIRPPREVARLDEEARREKHDVVKHGEWKHRKRDGTIIDVQVATGPIDWNGRHARVAVITDVTEIRRVTEALAAAEHIAHLGSWEYDAASDTLVWSEEMNEIMGRDSRSPRLTKESIWEYVHPDDREDVIRAVEAARDERRAFRVDYRIVRPDGEVRWVQGSGQFVFGKKGAAVRLFGIALDITERKLAEERLASYALHDGLTGLPNRLHMERWIAQSLTAEQDGCFVAVLVLGIDRFKNINDALGHAVGDTLLQAVPNRLRTGLAADDLIGRLGGDTFIVVLHRVERDADIAPIANNLLRLLREPFATDAHNLRVSASIGVSMYPRDARDADGLIKSAEGAMFNAKESGRDRVQFCAWDQQTQAVDRLRLGIDLSNALENDEFVLHYQPIVDFRTGMIIAAEALIRWVHPSRGLVAPGHFIPLAEDTGLIVPIGEWAIGEACRQMRTWRSAGLRDLRVAVNVSARQMRLENFTTTVSRALKDAGVDPESLVVEITERTIMNDPQVLETIKAVKRLGVRLSIDDFGTGYSSLANLRQFPFDIIKIDQSFVKELDVYDETVAKAVVALGHSLNMVVIAEGVETVTQRDRLRELSCDGMQGFLFSRPLSGEDFARLLARDERL